MNEKLVALELNNTWDIMYRPIDRKIRGFRWVFKIKYKANGNIERLILVAKGHTKIEGFDYTETFSR